MSSPPLHSSLQMSPKTCRTHVFSTFPGFHNLPQLFSQPGHPFCPLLYSPSTQGVSSASSSLSPPRGDAVGHHPDPPSGPSSPPQLWGCWRLGAPRWIPSQELPSPKRTVSPKAMPSFQPDYCRCGQWGPGQRGSCWPPLSATLKNHLELPMLQPCHMAASASAQPCSLLCTPAGVTDNSPHMPPARNLPFRLHWLGIESVMATDPQQVGACGDPVLMPARAPVSLHGDSS